MGGPLPPTSHHAFIGVGGFVGTGIYSKLDGGPYLLFGDAPFRRLPRLQFEFEASWTSQSSPSSGMRMHSIPLVGSLCWVEGNVRFCGGLATTMLFSNQSPTDDELMLGPNFRMGTELFNYGPFSIRADVFGRMAFSERRFGPAARALDAPTPFAAGLAVLGVGAFD